MKNLKLKLLASLIGLSSIGMAQAATETATLEVSTTVTATCTITAEDFTIEAFSPTSTTGSNIAISNIGAACTKGTPYDISFDGGLHLDVETRRMKHSTDSEYLVYELKDSMDFSSIPVSQSFYSDTGGGLEGVNVQVYSPLVSVSKIQNVIAGSYSDTLTVTVTY